MDDMWRWEGCGVLRLGNARPAGVCAGVADIARLTPWVERYDLRRMRVVRLDLLGGDAA